MSDTSDDHFSHSLPSFSNALLCCHSTALLIHRAFFVIRLDRLLRLFPCCQLIVAQLSHDLSETVYWPFYLAQKTFEATRNCQVLYTKEPVLRCHGTRLASCEHHASVERSCTSSMVYSYVVVTVGDEI